MSEQKMIHTWKGRPFEDLTHEELLVAAKWLANDLRQQRESEIESWKLMSELDDARRAISARR